MEKIMIEFKIQLPLINKELHRGQARFGKIITLTKISDSTIAQSRGIAALTL